LHREWLSLEPDLRIPPDAQVIISNQGIVPSPFKAKRSPVRRQAGAFHPAD
jgi:hypothetical protein